MSFPRRGHWYQTFKFAHDLLNPITATFGVHPIPFSDISKYFAHTNSAKCKDATQGTAQGRATLFKNCRQFIPGEVVALQPDVIVTQGTRARDSIAGAFSVLITESCPTSPSHKYQVLEIGHQRVLKFEMTHPTARMGSYQREVLAAWDWYMEVGHRFLLRSGNDRHLTGPGKH
jgi:hypothetical protein